MSILISNFKKSFSLLWLAFIIYDFKHMWFMVSLRLSAKIFLAVYDVNTPIVTLFKNHSTWHTPVPFKHFIDFITTFSTYDSCLFFLKSFYWSKDNCHEITIRKWNFFTPPLKRNYYTCLLLLLLLFLNSYSWQKFLFPTNNINFS